MSLTDVLIRKAKPADKPVRLFDGGGLYLEVSPSGGKLWRFKYKFQKREKCLSFGAYPLISLKEARAKRDEAKRLLADKIDPAAARKAQAEAVCQVADSFEQVGWEWFAKWRRDKAATSVAKAEAMLKADVFPLLGKTPVTEVNAPKVLQALNRIEERGAVDTAHRAKQKISQIMRHAIQTGRAEYDPCPSLKGALMTPPAKHFPTLTDPAKVGQLMRDIEGYRGRVHYQTRAALQLAPLVFIRPGELRQAKWADIDLAGKVWKFQASKCQPGEEPRIHIVPLARQAVAILEELHALSGTGEYVFPGVANPRSCLSDGTLNKALRSLGYDTKTEVTGHGFRAMARTLLAEELCYPPEVIEHQLAHSVPDALGTAYNRTKYLRQRTEMMQAWADYLDKLKAGAEVVDFPKVA